MYVYVCVYVCIQYYTCAYTVHAQNACISTSCFMHVYVRVPVLYPSAIHTNSSNMYVPSMLAVSLVLESREIGS